MKSRFLFCFFCFFFKVGVTVSVDRLSRLYSPTGSDLSFPKILKLSNSYNAYLFLETHKNYALCDVMKCVCMRTVVLRLLRPSAMLLGNPMIGIATYLVACYSVVRKLGWSALMLTTKRFGCQQLWQCTLVFVCVGAFCVRFTEDTELLADNFSSDVGIDSQ